MSCWNCKKKTKNFRCQECVASLRVNRAVFKQGKELSSDPEDRLIEDVNGTKVYGRDILQPRTSDGSVNQKFVDRYGDGMLNGRRSQLDGQGGEMSRVKARE